MRGAAVVRILTGVLFLAEGYSKVTGEFVRSGFRKQALQMAKGAFPFWGRFLERTVVPHAREIAWLFAVAELLVGLALLLGLMTRIACGGGMALMLSILLADANPGRGAPWHAWITAGLTAKFALLLFILLFAVDAGRVWGIDRRWPRSRARRA